MENDLLKKVRKIEIKTKALSHQVFAGEYHSAFKGRGMAFSEVREYQYGDDVRNMDWNVTARLRSPYVKIFEEERELTVMLLVDVSGSRVFGTTSQTKKDLLTEIAAVLSFSAAINNDKVGALFFSNKVEKFIPPKKGRSHLLRIIRELVVNAIRHGHAQHIRIAGEFRDGLINFSVRDDGSGFDPKSIQGPAMGHFGLQGIKERVNRLHGKMKIESEPGRGTKVTVELGK